MNIVIYSHEHRARARIVSDAMCQGILRQERRRPVVKTKPDPGDVDQFDVAVFYGMSPSHYRVWQDFKSADKRTVIIDLGYWGRVGSGGPGGRFGGYHKVSVDHWHPTAYLGKSPMPADRLKILGVTMKETRRPASKDAPILLVGMSRKGCDLYGIEVLSWERSFVETVRRQTRRPIVYRPKMALRDGPRINGTEWQDPQVPMGSVLRGDLFLVASHHSNAAIEALVEGLPVLVEDGAALPLSGSSLEIEAPRYTSKDERERLCRDLAYTQWNVLEMQAGLPWRHLRAERLV